VIENWLASNFEDNTMAANRWTRPLIGAFCASVAAASLASDKLTILSEGEAAQYWRPVPETMAMPGYPSIIADKSEDVCISVGYLLKEDGTTSDFSLLNAWSSGDASAKPSDKRFLAFAQNSLAAVQRWHFSSTAGPGARTQQVYTAASFAFSTRGTDAGQLRGQCQVRDLPGFIAKAQAEASKRSLNRARLESNRSNLSTVSGPKGTSISP
jgi:hypothetical protein